MIETLGTRNLYELDKTFDVISGCVLDALQGTETNQLFAMLLGGSHSKALENEDSDVDLVLYYLPTMQNLVKLRKDSFHILDTPSFRQIRENPPVYDCHGDEVEITIAPVRTIGGKTGKELWRGLLKCNMKVIHDFIKDYPLHEMDGASELRAFLQDGFTYSLKAVDGYFRGYMTSQLKAPGRQGDYDKRELKSYRENDIKPVVKAIINGIYIGLSGLAFIERREIYRDTWALMNKYEYLFDEPEFDFIGDIWQYKRERTFVAPMGTVKSWLARTRLFRNDIYETMVQAYDDAKLDSWIGTPTPAERRRNLFELDEMLIDWLGI